MRPSPPVLLFVSPETPARLRRRVPPPRRPSGRWATPHAAVGAFGDRELAPSAARSFRRHLATCPGCRARLAQLRALSAAVARATPVARAPDTLRARVTAELAAAARAGASLSSR